MKRASLIVEIFNRFSSSSWLWADSILSTNSTKPLQTSSFTGFSFWRSSKGSARVQKNDSRTTRDIGIATEDFVIFHPYRKQWRWHFFVFLLLVLLRFFNQIWKTRSSRDKEISLPKFPTTKKFYSFTGKAKNKHCTAVNCSRILFNNYYRVTITIGYPSKTVRKQLTEELASLGKAIEFGDEKRVARVVMKNTKLNKSVVNLVLKKLGEELNKRTNWRKNLSLLRNGPRMIWLTSG